MTLSITPSGQSCGARVTGVDLTQAIDAATVAAIRAAWLDHHVLSFPEQRMSDDDLERFTGYFGDFGDDPFIRPIPGRQHIIAVKRKAEETAPLFAENWHSDWSRRGGNARTAWPNCEDCGAGRISGPDITPIRSRASRPHPTLSTPARRSRAARRATA